MDVLPPAEQSAVPPNFSFLMDGGTGPPDDSAAVKELLTRWRTIGTTRGLKTDADVASFLVRFFEDTWRDQQSAAMCLSCHTPLTLCCLQCSGISALPNQASAPRTRKDDHTRSSVGEDLFGSTGLFGDAAKADSKVAGGDDLKCPLCFVQFTEVDQMTVHVLAHSTVMTHRCNVCNAAFLQPDVFELHKKIHPQDDESNLSAKDKEQQESDLADVEVKVEPNDRPTVEPSVPPPADVAPVISFDTNTTIPGSVSENANTSENSATAAADANIETPKLLDSVREEGDEVSSDDDDDDNDNNDSADDDDNCDDPPADVDGNDDDDESEKVLDRSEQNSDAADTVNEDDSKDDVTLLCEIPGTKSLPGRAKSNRRTAERNGMLCATSKKSGSYGCQRCGQSFTSLHELIVHSRCHYSSLRQKFAAARLEKRKPITTRLQKNKPSAAPQRITRTAAKTKIETKTKKDTKPKPKPKPKPKRRGRKPIKKLTVKMKPIPTKTKKTPPKKKPRKKVSSESDDSEETDNYDEDNYNLPSDAAVESDDSTGTMDYEVEIENTKIKKKSSSPVSDTPEPPRRRRGRPPKLPHEKKMKYTKRFIVPGLFRCKYCSRDMCNKDSLTAHERRHTGIKPYKCPSCSSSFFSRSALWAHIRTHSREIGDNSISTRRERPHRCKFCRNTYSHEESLREHIEEAHTNPQSPGKPPLPKSWVCDKCGKFYSNQKNFKAHLRRHEEGFNRVCPDCGKSFRGSSSLRSHMKLHRPGHNHLCSECGKTFQWAASLRQHKKLHETGGKGHVCPECGRTFQWAPSLAAHMKLHEVGGAFTCPICGKMFQWENTLQKHQKLHESGATIACPICAKTFQYAKSLPRHMQRFHAGVPTSMPLNASTDYSAESFEEALASSLSTNSLKTESAGLIHSCDQCGKTFEHSRSLSQHKRSHSGEKKFFVRNTIKPHPDRLRCPQCNLQCQSMAHFKRHLLTHRKENKPFECQECGKGYSDARSLKNHMQYHETGGMHACNECGKRFGTAQSLQRHQRQHDVNSGRVAGHQCPHCSRCFGDASHYKRHLMSHSKEKPFVCAICAKAYADSSALKYHNMQVHQGVQTLVCEVCNKSFYCTKQLENHACSSSSNSDHRQRKHRPPPQQQQQQQQQQHHHHHQQPPPPPLPPQHLPPPPPLQPPKSYY